MLRAAKRSSLLILLAVAVAACGEDTDLLELEITNEELTTEDPDAALVTAIESITNEMGLSANSLSGVSDGSEAPAFGNAVFASAFGGPTTPELSTSVAQDAVLTTLPPDQLRIYNVLAVWGRIRPRRDVEWSPIQWDPALQVAEGDLVRVRRELLFEAGDEVHPQEERNLVTMTSWTGPHVDGVTAQVAIVGPSVTPTNDAATTDHFLAFGSEPYSVSIPANELGGLHVTEVIDDTGNGLLLASLRQPPTPCAVGFMKGRWARTGERGGVFGGVWIQSNGRREGYLAGRWGVNASGAQVFHGKVVNQQGEFLAFMAGTYGGGVYEGEIYGRGRVLLGYMKGRYAGEDGHGHFLGGWRQACVTDTPNRVCRLTDAGVRICAVPTQPAEPTG